MSEPACAYCHEATGTVRPRRMPPWVEEETGIYLCRECWSDVIAGAMPRRAEP